MLRTEKMASIYLFNLEQRRGILLDREKAVDKASALEEPFKPLLRKFLLKESLTSQFQKVF